MFLLQRLTISKRSVKTELPLVKTLSGIRVATERMETKMLFLRLPVLLLAAFVVTVVGYYLFLVSGLIARKREYEIARLRSRGLSIFQIFRLQIIEGVVVIVLPALIAPLLAALAIGLAGKLPVFRSLTGGSHLPVELASFVWVWSGCLLYTSPSPRDATLSRMPSSA